MFSSEKVVADDEANALSLVLTEMRLLRPRSFGDCWLGCLLWDELGLGAFWNDKLASDRAGVPWSKVLQVLAVNRLCDPMSEFAVHRRWFLGSAMDELLGLDFAVAAKDRLYRCLDRILPHKQELCQFLAGRWKTLFDANFDVLLYDLTSTYFEGSCREIPKARHGYSRDGRSDCRQVVIALVVTSEGLPLAYEVLAGNRSDKTTLAEFLEKIQSMYGKARRVWVMDRGIPTKATLSQMRRDEVAYLVGTPKALLHELEQEMLDKPWERVHGGMKVKLLEKDGELYVRAHSQQRQKKEAAMRRRKLRKLLRGLNRLKCRPPKRDRLLKRVAVLQKEAGRVKSFVKVREPGIQEPVNRQTRWQLHSARLNPVGRLPGGDGEKGAGLVGVVHATGPRGGGVQDSQERPGPASDPSPGAAACRGPHPGCVPWLLPERDATDEIAGVGRRADAACGAPVDVTDSDVGSSHPHDRWTGADSSAAHGTGSGAGIDHGAPGDRASPAAAAADQKG